MRIISILLGVIAVLLTFTVVGLTIFSIAIGGGNVLFPGLGLVVSLPFLIVLLTIIDVLIISFALILRKISKQQKMP
jgi:hypothetical protein